MSVPAFDPNVTRASLSELSSDLSLSVQVMSPFVTLNETISSDPTNSSAVIAAVQTYQASIANIQNTLGGQMANTPFLSEIFEQGQAAAQSSLNNFQFSLNPATTTSSPPTPIGTPIPINAGAGFNNMNNYLSLNISLSISQVENGFQAPWLGGNSFASLIAKTGYSVSSYIQMLINIAPFGASRSLYTGNGTTVDVSYNQSTGQICFNVMGPISQLLQSEGNSGSTLSFSPTSSDPMQSLNTFLNA